MWRSMHNCSSTRKVFTRLRWLLGGAETLPSKSTEKHVVSSSNLCLNTWCHVWSCGPPDSKSQLRSRRRFAALWYASWQPKKKSIRLKGESKIKTPKGFKNLQKYQKWVKTSSNFFSGLVTESKSLHFSSDPRMRALPTLDWQGWSSTWSHTPSAWSSQQQELQPVPLLKPCAQAPSIRNQKPIAWTENRHLTSIQKRQQTNSIQILVFVPCHVCSQSNRW